MHSLLLSFKLTELSCISQGAKVGKTTVSVTAIFDKNELCYPRSKGIYTEAGALILDNKIKSCYQGT
jgi:hypothetical protein